jgi:glycosyltransferase involved in cell wall biosynthesis/peptidoglycan/xylan/chitin deacetylase (PgdA/CDA1 family)
MLLNKIYYQLKPFMPWRLRLALRQARAKRRRKAFSYVWPIDPKAGIAPQGWRGWPGGKSFAFVLTHDVEGSKGLSRVERLAELELKHGFHSSFNFVPEGEYRLPEHTRQFLDRAGFEVGVHGLEHDGKLYDSPAQFVAKSKRIGKYLQKWNAVGFRSPLMQHRLGWLHALGAEYDSSSFDTDPFEPEPDGFGTIFPFWVTDAAGGGYTELPYTMVQDFNLFITLREKDITIWKKKVDWIAERGGMVLLNTHPDYMCFDGAAARDEYPASRYEDFLRYVRERYDGQYWAALPREVARHHCKSNPVNSRNTRRRVCMLAYTFYEFDNRVRRYAETLARRGDHVDVIALSGPYFQQPVEEINGVTVHRIQHREYNETSKWAYASRLLRFLVKSSRYLARLYDRHRYDVIHVHNMPDFLVFAAWYPKMRGAKLILDVHDIVPELFENKFKTRISSTYSRALKAIEKASAQFVDHVIVSNDLWATTLVERSVPREKCSVCLNHVDLSIFYQRPRTRQDDRFIVVFPGSLQWHQGLDIAIEAFARFKREVPNAEFHLYSGSGEDQKTQLLALAQKLGVGESVKSMGGVRLDEMPQVIANADLGVVPKRADSFGNEAYSTKIMEFMSQGIPVVASRTKIDTYYYQEGTVHFFESGNSEDMARAMLDVFYDKQLREALKARGYEYSQQNSWDQKKQRYLDLIDFLSTERFESVASSKQDADKTVRGVATNTAVRRGFEPVILNSDRQTVHKAD